MRKPASFAAHVAGALLLIGVACASGVRTGQPTDEVERSGVLSGSVVRVPASPVEGIPGAGEPKPAPGVVLSVRPEAGGEALTVTSDEYGEFSRGFVVGTYRVELATPPATGFTKDLPRTITITAGQTTRLDVRLDSGLR